jgi:hypothetical protein
MISLLSARIPRSTPTRIKRKLADMMGRKLTNTTEDRDFDDTESLASTVPLEKKSQAGVFTCDFLDSQSPRYRHDSSSFEMFLGKPIERVLSLNGCEKEVEDEDDDGVFQRPFPVEAREEVSVDQEEGIDSTCHVSPLREEEDGGIVSRDDEKEGRRPCEKNINAWAERWLENQQTPCFVPIL